MLKSSLFLASILFFLGQAVPSLAQQITPAGTDQLMDTNTAYTAYVGSSGGKPVVHIIFPITHSKVRFKGIYSSGMQEGRQSEPFNLKPYVGKLIHFSIQTPLGTEITPQDVYEFTIIESAALPSGLKRSDNQTQVTQKR